MMLVLVCSTLAFGADEMLVIYNGTMKVPANVELGDWGHFPWADREKAYQPSKEQGMRAYSLRLVTLGRYQGARLDFPTPLDTTEIFASKGTYLELYLRAVPGAIVKPDTTIPSPDGMMPGGPGVTPGMPGMNSGMPGPGGAPGGVPAPMPGMAPGGAIMPPMAGGAPGMAPNPGMMPPTNVQPGMMPPTGGQPGMMPGGGMPGTAPNPGGNEAVPGLPPEPQPKPKTIPAPSFTNLRITFVTEQGQALLDVQPSEFHPADEVDNAWVRVALPLAKLNKSGEFGGKLTRMLFTSDAPIEFLLGRIAFVRETEPFTASFTTFPTFLEAGQRIFFIARVEAGLTRYETTWNFGVNPPPAVDATGDRVTFVYDLEGTYTITCTVRDLNDGKDTRVITKEIKVTRARE
jgi:hypothetical protein